MKEILVRTQDGRKLIKCSEFKIERKYAYCNREKDWYDEYKLIGYGSSFGKTILGVYINIEEAILCLDKIFECLMDDKYFYDLDIGYLQAIEE